MVSAGDLVRSEDGYRLSDRLLARQRRQDDAINPQLKSWDGTWTTLVITSVGTDARTRAGLRTTLQQNRFAELREGVWLRPDNLKIALPRRRAVAGAGAARLRRPPRRTGRPTVGSAGLGAHRQASCSTDMAAATDVPGRFVAAAGMVRHLLTDPVLPDELLPDGWPGDRPARVLCAIRRRTGGTTKRDRTDGGAMSVRVERNGPVTTVIMNRPEARNAVNGPTAAELFAAFDEFDRDESASVAVLWGDNGTFCAGADLKAFGTPDVNPAHRTGPGPMGPTRMVLSKPVIAAVSGYAVAGGLELALWCDLRVVEEDATMGVFCRRWGVPLIDGGTVRLPRLIGHSRAMDMILTGRGVDAAEALAMGLANRVVPKGQAREKAEELAAELAALPQHVHAGRPHVAAQPVGVVRNRRHGLRIRQPVAGRGRVAGGRAALRQGRRTARRTRLGFDELPRS